ncbi:HD domain-containing protein [Rubrivirga sp. IMCC43871]|uniref:HD domain-containing protein n=1 Tax=Rubrivirga sp. IMCC43871 TaxID=3391575 RepID=UPI00398FEA15
MSPAEIAGWSARCEAHIRQTMAGDVAHDLAHVRRVVRAARQLAEAEGADLGVVVPAAWLHDGVTVAKDSPDRARASRIAADAATAWLRQQGFDEGRVAAVAHAIEAHSFTAGIEPETAEAAVVQDADRLDALGAIGVARCYAMSAVFGSQIVHPDDPVPSEPPARPLDDQRYATDHFFVKLLGLPATMRTVAGRAEAERRVAFIRDFLRQLATEVG